MKRYFMLVARNPTNEGEMCVWEQIYNRKSTVGLKWSVVTQHGQRKEKGNKPESNAS